MTIPPLNEYGLLDEGIYECTTEQIAAQFVFTETRKTLWNNFCTFIERANHKRLFCAVYLDGSFVSNKPEPQDIDIVLEFCPMPFPNNVDWSELQKVALQRENIKDMYALDVAVAPMTQNDNDFRSFFQYIRLEQALKMGLPPTAKKGILKLNLP